ncbi:RNA polymerase sigma factor [Brevibacillus invocatus]|uniref:RNA polymerase sigma factor n=1 Tax=Brevibacillus invocatus TaxID=173959 RepID=A0A3M8CHR4_9BACL|nr:RNA polymerase sigma factor [Brevibacillus invocatus]
MRILDGNQQEIETWFTLYSNELYSFLVYYLGHHDVEDLVQDVFIKAIRKQSQFSGKATRKTWLFSIARNHAIDHLRKERLRKWVKDPFMHAFSSSEKSVEERYVQKEEINQLYEAVSRLKVSYREVVLLYGIQGFSAAETAQVLRCSESNVHVTFYRARKQLRKWLEENQEGGDFFESFVK